MYFTLSLHDYLDQINKSIIENSNGVCPVCYDVMISDINFYHHFNRCYVVNRLNVILLRYEQDIKLLAIEDLRYDIINSLPQPPDYDSVFIT